MSRGEVLQAIERELKAILDTDFLEETRQINLHCPLRDQQHRGDLFVLEPLAEQADQLAFALSECDALGGQKTVGECLFKPKFAFIYALEAFNQQLRRQRLAEDSANAERHGLQRQFGRYRVHPQHYFCIDRSFFELAQNAEGDIRSQIDQQNVGFARIQDLFELDSAGADTSQVKAIDTGQDGFESFGQNRFIAEEKRSCHFAHQNIIDVN